MKLQTRVWDLMLETNIRKQADSRQVFEYDRQAVVFSKNPTQFPCRIRMGIK